MSYQVSLIMIAGPYLVPMDMIFEDKSMRFFQAKQQWSKMSSNDAVPAVAVEEICTSFANGGCANSRAGARSDGQGPRFRQIPHDGISKAKVALARKLGVILYRRWVDGTRFVDRGGSPKLAAT